MTSLTDREIETIVHGVMERTLPKAAWTHEAHFCGGDLDDRTPWR